MDRITICLENSIKSSLRETYSFVDDTLVDLFK